MREKDTRIENENQKRLGLFNKMIFSSYPTDIQI